jgi:hypothetical protein
MAPTMDHDGNRCDPRPGRRRKEETMLDSEIQDLARGRANGRLARLDRGDLVFHPHLRPCRVKILMVVDGHPGSFLNASFSHSYFGLSAVLDTLRTNPEYFVKFDVTRAHRQIDHLKPDPVTEPVEHERYGPHFENFRFTQKGFDINQFHQVWLFGVRDDPDDAARLTDAELAVLARWMDERQGGLFATGDHADLGAALCSRVPRAGTMRKWTPAQGVPSPVGPDRHDTLDDGHNATYTFDDESDDIPMRTELRWYPLSSWSFLERRRAPHPVLCGTGGPIDILPDHPHEGEVIDEAVIDLNATFGPFDGYGNAEYPSSVVGFQPRPEVIAWARVLPGHTETADTNKGAANTRRFGVIGVYDGHGVNVGRVCVDSTWHHWFDVNLTGRPVLSLDSLPMDDTNPKTLGFLGTPAGQAQYARIQNYFRNVAIWLADPSAQRCMALRAVWGGVLRYPATERLDPKLPVWELGRDARDAIGRRATQCTLSEWILDVFPALEIDLRERFKPRPDPCLTCPPWELFEVFALGGATRQLLELSRKVEDLGSGREGETIDEEIVADAFVRGVRSGVGEALERLPASLQETGELVESLSRVLPDVREAQEFLERPPIPSGAPEGARAKKAPKTAKVTKKGVRRRG